VGSSSDEEFFSKGFLKAKVAIAHKNHGFLFFNFAIVEAKIIHKMIYLNLATYLICGMGGNDPIRNLTWVMSDKRFSL